MHITHDNVQTPLNWQRRDQKLVEFASLCRKYTWKKWSINVTKYMITTLLYLVVTLSIQFFYTLSQTFPFPFRKMDHHCPWYVKKCFYPNISQSDSHLNVRSNPSKQVIKLIVDTIINYYYFENSNNLLDLILNLTKIMMV